MESQRSPAGGTPKTPSGPNSRRQSNIDEKVMPKSEEKRSPGGTPGAPMPTNIDEFLEKLHLKDWPAPLVDNEFSLQIAPDKILNRSLIKTKLLQAARFGILRDDIDMLQSRIAALADNFIVEKALVPATQLKKTFYAPPITFLTEIAESEIVHSLAGGKKGKQVVSGENQEVVIYEDERCFNVLKAGFPGLKPDAATDLPNWIELPGIVEKVAQTLEINGNLRPLWRQIYLSQASIVLMQDGFWWLFLDYFKRTLRHLRNPHWDIPIMEQDDVIDSANKLFDRMADTYVTLFFSVDRALRDKFFQDYTTIVSQSLFLCFADAFPDSQYLYDDAFKSYLADSVSLWLRGVKAPPAVYRTWAVNSMLKADKIEAERKQRQANMVFDPTTLDEALTQLGPIQPVKSVRLVSATPKPSRQMGLTSQAVSSGVVVPPSASRASVPAQGSLPIGASSKIERVKFRLTGNCQLMDHHMRMHGVPVVGGPLAVRSQEVALPPNNNKTYADLIKESRKAMKTLEKSLANMEKDTHDEISRIRRQYAADMQERREGGKIKTDARAVDPAKVAAMEVREMMKRALKNQESSRPADEEELNATLLL